MKVTVRTLDSQNHEFELDNDQMTVKEFKEFILSTVKIEVATQRIIFKGKVLQDDKKLKEYGVDGFVVHLVQKAPPSASRPASSTSSASSSAQSQRSSNSTTTANSRLDGVAQNLVDNLINQFGASNVSASQSGNSVNVNVNVSQTAQNGDDVRRRIGTARRFLSHAEHLLMHIQQSRPSNTTQTSSGHAHEHCPNHPHGHSHGENNQGHSHGHTSQEEAMETDQTATSPTTESSSDNENSTDNNTESQVIDPSPSSLSSLLGRFIHFYHHFQPSLRRYERLLENPQAPDRSTNDDLLPDQVAEILHDLSHMFHAMSDLTFNFNGPEPRQLSSFPQMSPMVLPMPLQGLVGMGGGPSGLSTPPQSGTNASMSMPAMARAQFGGQTMQRPVAVTAISTVLQIPASRLQGLQNIQPPTSIPNFTDQPPRTLNANSTTVPNVPPQQASANMFQSFLSQGQGTGNQGSFQIRSGNGGGNIFGSVSSNVVYQNNSSSSTSESTTSSTPTPTSATPTSTTSSSNLPLGLQNIMQSIMQNLSGGVANTMQSPLNTSSVFSTSFSTSSTGSTTTTGPNVQFSSTSSPWFGPFSAQMPGQPTFGPRSTQPSNTQASATPSAPPAATGSQPTAPPSGRTHHHIHRARVPPSGNRNAHRPHPHHHHHNPDGSVMHPDNLLPCGSFHFGPTFNQGGGSESVIIVDQARRTSTSNSTSTTNTGGTTTQANANQTNSTGGDNLPVDISNLLNGIFGGLSQAGQQAAEVQVRIENSEDMEEGGNPAGIEQMILNALQSNLSQAFGGTNTSTEGGRQTLRDFMQENFGMTDESDGTMLSDFMDVLADNLTMSDLIGFFIGGSSSTSWVRLHSPLRQLIEKHFNNNRPMNENNLQEVAANMASGFGEVTSEIEGELEVRAGVNLKASLRNVDKKMFEKLLRLLMQSAGEFSVGIVDWYKLYSAWSFSLLDYAVTGGADRYFQLLMSSPSTEQLLRDISPQLRQMVLPTLTTRLRQVANQQQISEEELNTVIVRTAKSSSRENPCKEETGRAAKRVKKNEKVDVNELWEELHAGNELLSDSDPEGESPPQQEDWHNRVPHDWVLLINRDAERQRKAPKQRPYSDAYLNGLPPKKRQALTQHSSDADRIDVGATLNRSIEKTGINKTKKKNEASNFQEAIDESDLQNMFDATFRHDVRQRLQSDVDYSSKQFPNAEKYFMKDDDKVE